MKNKPVEQLAKELYPKNACYFDGYPYDCKKDERTAFTKGYEEGLKNKWVNVKDKLPEAYHQHGRVHESDQVLLDCGDFYIVSRYTHVMDQDFMTVLFVGFDGIEDQEIVERWMEIVR